MIRRLLVVSLFAMATAACGGGDSNPTTDAPSGSDAASSNVETVDPCTGESATVTAPNTGNTYSPKDTTISVGQIVKFEMDSFHNVAPATGSDDPGLTVGFGATACLKFTAAGTYNFKCTAHGFTGSITVQ